MCIFPPVKLLYNLLFPAIWQENITITIKSNLRLLPINEICPILKWVWNNLWKFYSQIRMEIIPQGGINVCKTASIIYFLISFHSWNNVIIGRQHKKFNAIRRILEINAGKRKKKYLWTHNNGFEINAILNLGGTLNLVLVNNSLQILFVYWPIILLIIGKLS